METHGNQETAAGPPSTLGDVLYARPGKPLAAESGWVELVRSIAAGDQAALHGLYERAHCPVYTLAVRITCNREAAEEATLDVFHDVWRRAWAYDPANGTVLGWVMNQARSRAIDRVRIEGRKKCEEPAADVPGPGTSLQGRLAERIAEERGEPPVPPPPPRWSEPEWDEVAPGIFCKLLANDAERDRVSMLVRLLPGVEYPPHTHAGLEELHLLEGELWIDGRRLRPGDYNRAEAPTGDQRVWSETGCACVLVTSTQDILR